MRLSIIKEPLPPDIRRACRSSAGLAMSPRAGACPAGPLLAVVVLLAACTAAGCSPVSNKAATPAGAPAFKRGSTPATPRHLPDTNQIVRQRQRRGKATSELWNIVNVGGGGTPPPPPTPPGGRPRPRIVRAVGDEQPAQSVASRRQLRASADGADSSLASIPVGGCSVTNYNVNVKVKFCRIHHVAGLSVETF